MIEVEGVTRYFGDFRAVNDISLSISKGEIVGLLGPNGAGKTTTMRMITGYLIPTSGSISIDGQDALEHQEESKSKIGYLPESAPLYEDMMVLDYLRYTASIHGIKDESRLNSMAGQCGLYEVMHKNISELSRGYKQRVGLAHALLHDPEILILDEPTSGLDPNQIIEVRNLIKKIGETKTVIISTHILPEVEMLCDRVIIVSNGSIVADSPTDQLRLRYGHSASLKLQLKGPSFEEVKAALQSLNPGLDISETEGEGALTSLLISTSSDEDLRPDVFSLIAGKAAQGWVLYEMVQQQNTLEDVFHDLTLGDQSLAAQTEGGLQ